MTQLPSRSELRRLDKRSDDRAEFAERLIAEMYGLEYVGDEGDWYDAVLESTGAKYQVKSTAVKRVKGSSGRFRLWESDHRSLVGSDTGGVAWYAFVLFDGKGGIVDVVRRKPSTVTTIVRESGAWNEAGHQDKPGDRQLKIPYGRVMNR